MENIKELVDLERSEFWNKAGPAWQNVVVCVIIDGIDPCDKGTLDVLATVGVYQDDVLKKDVDGRETVAHIFEYTTQLSVTANQQLIRPLGEDTPALPPVQLMLCLKQRNSRKINSHRWLYQAFGRILNPEIVIKLDVGTSPAPRAFLNLWRAFYNDRHLGGACGQLHCDLGKNKKMLLNPLVAAQHFEYKTACQLDRASEAATGYITVLPGSFSAYRFRAIIGRPLEQYFHGDYALRYHLGKKGIDGMSLLRKNMYLAEDRILCFETVMKNSSKWHMGCVKDAHAEADVPANISDFISQRRRWLNGTFASTVYNIINFTRVYRSEHSILRIAIFHLQLIFNIVNFLLAWTSLAAYLLTVFIVNDISGDPPADSAASGFPFGGATPTVNAIIQIVYICTIVFQFLLAMGNRPQGQWLSYTASLAIFGVIQLYLVMNLVYLFKRVADFRFHTDDQTGQNFEYISIYYSDIGEYTVILSGIAAFGVHIAVAIMRLDPWHIFSSYAQYLFVLSSYTNILSVYAFCNFDDYSWGPKEQRSGSFFGQASAISKTSGDKEQIIEEPEVIQGDLDKRFEATVKRALTPHDSTPGPTVVDLNDSMKAFRTRLLAAYIFSNFFICIFVLNDSFAQLHWLGDSYWHKVWFFRIWLWAQAACFYLRFLGALWDTGRSWMYGMFIRS